MKALLIRAIHDDANNSLLRRGQFPLNFSGETSPVKFRSQASPKKLIFLVANISMGPNWEYTRKQINEVSWALSNSRRFLSEEAIFKGEPANYQRVWELFRQLNLICFILLRRGWVRFLFRMSFGSYTADTFRMGRQGKYLYGIHFRSALTLFLGKCSWQWYRRGKWKARHGRPLFTDKVSASFYFTERIFY